MPRSAKQPAHQHAAAKPLTTVKGAAPDASQLEVVEWNGTTSARTFHVFINETTQPAELYWFHDRTEEHHGTIQPGSNLYVGTYTFNQWKVKSGTGRLLGVHAGQSATVTIKPQGCVISFNTATVDADNREATSMTTPKGLYAVRTSALGIPVWAFDCVEDQAVQRAAHITACMLEGCPASVLQAMLGHKLALAVFGRNHVVTDVPPHSFMKHNTDRHIDNTARGLGATTAVPVVSCAEENLTMEGDKMYPCQSILVHEMGHAVQNLGMDAALNQQVEAAWRAALDGKLYPDGCYMVCNPYEYWATGTEAWFESTIRKDVNGGINTRAKLCMHDPRLATVLAQVYGDTPWRYQHDAPHTLSFYPTPYPSLRHKPNKCNSASSSVQSTEASVASSIDDSPTSPKASSATPQVSVTSHNAGLVKSRQQDTAMQEALIAGLQAAGYEQEQAGDEPAGSHVGLAGHQAAQQSNASPTRDGAVSSQALANAGSTTVGNVQPKQQVPVLALLALAVASINPEAKVTARAFSGSSADTLLHNAPIVNAALLVQLEQEDTPGIVHTNMQDGPDVCSNGTSPADARLGAAPHVAGGAAVSTAQAEGASATDIASMGSVCTATEAANQSQHSSRSVSPCWGVLKCNYAESAPAARPGVQPPSTEGCAELTSQAGRCEASVRTAPSPDALQAPRLVQSPQENRNGSVNTATRNSAAVQEWLLAVTPRGHVSDQAPGRSAAWMLPFSSCMLGGTGKTKHRL